MENKYLYCFLETTGEILFISDENDTETMLRNRDSLILKGIKLIYTRAQTRTYSSGKIVEIKPFLSKKGDTNNNNNIKINSSDDHERAIIYIIKIIKKGYIIKIKRFCKICGKLHIIENLPEWNNKCEIGFEKGINIFGKYKQVDVLYKHWNFKTKRFDEYIIEVYHTHKTEEKNRAGKKWVEINATSINNTPTNNNTITYRCHRESYCKTCENKIYTNYENKYNNYKNNIKNVKYIIEGIKYLKEKLIIFKNKLRFENLINKLENIKKYIYATIIQKNYKSYIQVEKFKYLKNNAIIIQKNARKYILRDLIKNKIQNKDNAIKIQRFIKYILVKNLLYKNIGIKNINKLNYDLIFRFIIEPLRYKTKFNYIKFKNNLLLILKLY